MAPELRRRAVHLQAQTVRLQVRAARLQVQAVLLPVRVHQVQAAHLPPVPAAEFIRITTPIRSHRI